MKHEELRDRFVEVLGQARVVDTAEALSEFAEDQTENPARRPSLAVKGRTVEEVRAIVALAAESEVPITPRVEGTNLGGIAIPSLAGFSINAPRATLDGPYLIFEGTLRHDPI